MARKKAAADELRAQEKFMMIGTGEAQCKGCGYTYDPKLGDPEYPIAKGIKFEVCCFEVLCFVSLIVHHCDCDPMLSNTLPCSPMLKNHTLKHSHRIQCIHPPLILHLLYTHTLLVTHTHTHTLSLPPPHPGASRGLVVPRVWCREEAV